MPPPPPAPSNVAEQPPPPSDDAPVILVVEDDLLVRRALYDLLDFVGYRVILTEDTTSAFTVLIEPGQRVDCIVADLKLDRRSGTRDGAFLLDYVANEAPRCGRIIYTGYAGELEPDVFTAHTVVMKGGPPFELRDATRAEIERRPSAATAPHP